jgi:hypothetical protein
MARPGYPSYGPSTGEYPLDDPSARFAGMFNRLRRGVKESPAGASAAQAARGYAARPGMYGTLSTAAAYAGSQALQGDPMGALVGGLGSLTGGVSGMGIASLASKLPLPGPLGAALRFGLPIVGSLIGGGFAEQAAGAFGAKATEAGQRPGAGPDVELGGVPMTETAATRKQLEFDRKQQLQYIQQIGGAEMALNKELLGYMMTQEVEQQKAMLPLMERMQRTVNSRTLNQCWQVKPLLTNKWVVKLQWVSWRWVHNKNVVLPCVPP